MWEKVGLSGLASSERMLLPGHGDARESVLKEGGRERVKGGRRRGKKKEGEGRKG